MIERVNTKNYTECAWLLEFLTSNMDYDFYFTEDNTRIYITDMQSLKRLFKSSEHIFYLKEYGDVVGVILVWKSEGGGKERKYVKLSAKNFGVARDLLTVLMWNCFDDLYFKIRKDSKLIPVVRHKGFRFEGGRGSQILLKGKAKEYVSFSSKDKDE